jgi:uncharacterized protein YjfI (DUF2170 family)
MESPMTPQQKLQQLAVGLNGAILDNGLSLSSEVLAGEVDVLLTTVEQREEFPIYITVDESQILCITYLWTEAEVDPNKRIELLDTLLSMNIPMPLSSFSKIGNQYVIFGALSTHSSLEEILEELHVLSDNTLTAVEELAEYRL